MAVRAKAAALAGDIGGTKTVSGSPASRVDRRFRCATSSTRRDFKSLEDVARDFLSGARAIDAACFYVPTPIARRESSDPRCMDRISNRIRRPL